MSTKIRLISFLFIAVCVVNSSVSPAFAQAANHDWEKGTLEDPINPAKPSVAKFAILLRDLSYPEEFILSTIRLKETRNEFEIRRQKKAFEKLMQMPRTYNKYNDIYLTFGLKFLVPISYDFDNGTYEFCIFGKTDIFSSAPNAPLFPGAESIRIDFNLTLPSEYKWFKSRYRCDDNKGTLRQEWLHSKNLAHFAEDTYYNERSGLWLSIPMDEDTAEQIYLFSQKGGMMLSRLECRLEPQDKELSTSTSFSKHIAAEPKCEITTLEYSRGHLDSIEEKLPTIKYEENVGFLVNSKVTASAKQTEEESVVVTNDQASAGNTASNSNTNNSESDVSDGQSVANLNRNTEKFAQLIETFASLEKNEMARRVQSELNRLGCGAGDVDGQLGAKSKRAFTLFMKALALSYTSDDLLNPEALAEIAITNQPVCSAHWLANNRPSALEGNWSGTQTCVFRGRTTRVNIWAKFSNSTDSGMTASVTNRFVFNRKKYQQKFLAKFVKLGSESYRWEEQGNGNTGRGFAFLDKNSTSLSFSDEPPCKNTKLVFVN